VKLTLTRTLRSYMYLFTRPEHRLHAVVNELILGYGAI
jgi:hypothetical protein